MDKRKSRRKSKRSKIKRKIRRSKNQLKTFKMVTQDLKYELCTKIPSHTNNTIQYEDKDIISISIKDFDHYYVNTEYFSGNLDEKGKMVFDGKYKIIEYETELGEGAYGTVYVGSVNGESIILKSIKYEENKIKKTLENTKREITIQSHLACFHNEQLKNMALIPEIYFLARVTHENRLFIGMERIDWSLRKLIKHMLKSQNINSIHQLQDIIIDAVLSVAKTLDVLQKSCKFMHRDLHSSNVMCKGDINKPETLQWYIIDFGMAALDIDALVERGRSRSPKRNESHRGSFRRRSSSVPIRKKMSPRRYKKSNIIENTNKYKNFHFNPSTI